MVPVSPTGTTESFPIILIIAAYEQEWGKIAEIGMLRNHWNYLTLFEYLLITC